MVKKPDIPAYPKPDLRSWCNPLPPNYPEAMQLQRLTGELYKPDRKRDARAALIASVRDGSIVEVCAAFLLAQTTGRVDVRRRDLTRVMDEIEDRGGIIRELSTGDETPKGRRRMRERAFEAITNHARRPQANGALSTGRPATWPKSGPTYEGYRNIWHCRRYGNVNQRRTAIIRDFGDSPSGVWLRQQFGSPHDTRELPPPAVKPKKLRRRKCYAYFIFDGVKVKIGHSTDPWQVLRALRRGNHGDLELLGVCGGGPKREVLLHKKFSKFRGRGEWFTFAPEIKRYIARYARKLRKS